MRNAFAEYHRPYVNIDVLLTWGTSRFSSVQVTHASREVGESNYTVRLLLRHALNMITGFSTLPLKLASLMGFAFTVFGMLVSDLCARPLRDLRRRHRAWFCVSRLDHRDFFGCAVVCDRHDRRVSRADAFPPDGISRHLRGSPHDDAGTDRGLSGDEVTQKLLVLLRRDNS